MKLEEIGFYTLSDERVKNTSQFSDLMRCELILTGACNFKCVNFFELAVFSWPYLMRPG